MQRYKQLPIIRYGSKKSMIKKDKKHVSKSTLLKSKIQASPNDRFGLNGLMTVRGLISKKNRLAFTCNSLTKGVSLHYIKYVT